MNRSAFKRFLLFLIVVPVVLVMVGCNSSSKPWPPTPRPGTGVVIGKVAPASKTGYHYSAQDLYLGKLLPAGQPDAQPAVSFTFGTDPGTTVHNPDGTFAFTNIVPGTYVLIIWAPENSFVVKLPEGGLIKVVIEKDKVTDLGNIVLP
jgi:hypothetical protein